MIDRDHLIETLKKQSPVWAKHFSNDTPYPFQDIKIVLSAPPKAKLIPIESEFSETFYIPDFAHGHARVSKAIGTIYGKLRSAAISATDSLLTKHHVNTVIALDKSVLFGNWRVTDDGTATTFHCRIKLEGVKPIP